VGDLANLIRVGGCRGELGISEEAVASLVR